MVKAELLTEISVAEFTRLCELPHFGLQEKYNGERRIICKQGSTIRAFNRDGKLGKPLPSSIVAALRKHPLDVFVIDTEVVKSTTLYIFDALYLGDEELIHDAYEYREARYHVTFDNYHPQIVPVKTIRDTKAKLELVLALLQSGGEGVVAKDMRATYKEGRCGQHFKLKFWKTLDAVVIAPSPEGKDSVRIGVYDDRGKMHEVSGVSLCGKFRVKVGDVIEVRYLYATPENNIVQPTMLHKRLDKKPEECRLSQLVLNKNWR